MYSQRCVIIIFCGSHTLSSLTRVVTFTYCADSKIVAPLIVVSRNTLVPFV